MLKTAKIKIQDYDLQLCISCNQLSKRPTWALFFQIISRLGNGSFWLMMAAICLYRAGALTVVWLGHLILSLVVSCTLYKYLKSKTSRPRPYQVHQVIRLGEHPLDYFSFPSGHTLHAVMLTIMLGYFDPILLYAMLPFTCLVALSRMVLGLHYPSDVIVGAGIGAGIAALTLYLSPWL